MSGVRENAPGPLVHVACVVGVLHKARIDEFKPAPKEAGVSSFTADELRVARIELKANQEKRLELEEQGRRLTRRISDLNSKRLAELSQA